MEDPTVKILLDKIGFHFYNAEIEDGMTLVKAFKDFDFNHIYEGRSLLYHLALGIHPDTETLVEFLSYNVDINFNGGDVFRVAITFEDRDFAKYLIRKGFDPNVYPNCLMQCISSGFYTLVPIIYDKLTDKTVANEAFDRIMDIRDTLYRNSKINKITSKILKMFEVEPKNHRLYDTVENFDVGLLIILYEKGHFVNDSNLMFNAWMRAYEISCSNIKKCVKGKILKDFEVYVKTLHKYNFPIPEKYQIEEKLWASAFIGNTFQLPSVKTPNPWPYKNYETFLDLFK